MAKLKYDWKYGENSEQKYYETKVGEQTLCVFANKWQSDIWMGLIDLQSIYNKTINNKQRKKQGLAKGCNISLLSSWALLSNSNPEYMMQKVEHCFRTGKTEVCQ